MEMEKNSMFNFLKFSKEKRSEVWSWSEIYKIDEIGDDDKYVF